MAQHWYEKLVEVSIGAFRRRLTNRATWFADYTLERFPAIRTLFEQVGGELAADIMNIFLEALPDPDTKTPLGKGLDLGKDMAERFIHRLQEGLNGRRPDGDTDTVSPIAPDAAKNLFRMYDPKLRGKFAEFLGFLMLLTPRQRKAVVEFVLDPARSIADVRAFFARPVDERVRFLSLLIPRTKTSEIERLEAEIRIRWTYSERLFAEAAILFAEADAIRSADRAAAAEKDIDGGEREDGAQQLVAPLNDLQAELLRLGRVSPAVPAVPTALNNALQRIRAWDKQFAPKKREPKGG